MSKKISFSVMIVVLAALILSSIPSMLANIYAHQFDRQENRWKKSLKSVDVDNWNKAYSSLSTAIKMDPYNPDYLEMMGRLYSWKYWINSSNDIDLKSLGLSGEALQRVSQSLVQRPYWSYGWSQKAYLKFLMGEVDSEFWQAYENALASGRWEKEVFYNLMNAGAGAWSSLSWTQRDVVVSVFQRAIIFDKKIAFRVLSILKSHKMKAPFCYSLKSLAVPAYIVRACSR
jgi:hypothetical protein